MPVISQEEFLDPNSAFNRGEMPSESASGATPPAVNVADPGAIPDVPVGFEGSAYEVAPQEAVTQDNAPPKMGGVVEPSGPRVVSQAEFVGENADNEDAGFLDRLNADFVVRQRKLNEVKQQFNNGEITAQEAIASLFSKVTIASFSDILGQTFKSVGSGLNALVPNAIGGPVNKAGAKAAKSIADTDTWQLGVEAIQAGGKIYDLYKKAHPRDAEQLENLGIALLAMPASPFKGVKAPTPTTAIGKAGEAIAKSAEVQTANQRSKFVESLVLPKQTLAVKAEQVGRTTEEGLLKQKVVNLSPAQREVANEVSQIPEVGPSKTLQGNYTVINDAVVTEAESLKTLLKENEVLIPRKEVSTELNKIIPRLIEEDPAIVGDAAKSAKTVVNKMKSIVNKHPGTASGLLDARKEIDAWIGRRSEKLLDPTTGTAMTSAISEVRNTVNSMIAAKSPNVAVKASLKKQSNLFKAMDALKLKSADEAEDIIKRSWQNVTKVLGVKSGFAQAITALAGVAGVSLVGAMPMLRDTLITGGVTYVAGKIILSPKLKKIVSKSLEGIDQAIRKTNDQDLISRLRLDRAAMVELLDEDQPER